MSTTDIRYCPRCKSPYPVGDGYQYFAEPLTVCLACYKRYPGNDGLNATQLLEKAKRSRRGRIETRPERFAAVRSFIASDTVLPLEWTEEERKEWEENNRLAEELASGKAESAAETAGKKANMSVMDILAKTIRK